MILKKLKHQNVVTFIALQQIDGEVFMIMEFMNGGSLLSYIKQNEKSLTEEILMNMAEQICCGMQYLEENNIIHKYLFHFFTFFLFIFG